MGNVQPGIGYTVTDTPDGSSLEILFPPQQETIIQQFQTEIVTPGATATIRVAKGHVITQDVWEDTFEDVTTVEFSLEGVWAYPTGSKTTGSDANGAWMDSGGTITISNAASEGSDSWGVYIVRQPFNKVGQKHTAELIVINDDYLSPSDAYTKTTPWGTPTGLDSIRLITVANATSVTIDGTPSDPFVTSFDPNPSQYNYNCQRVKVAGINWDATIGGWKVSQLLIGSITLPNIVQYYGTEVGIDGARPDTYWPNFETECDAWNGAWTGYAKAGSPTSFAVVPSGFPA